MLEGILEIILISYNRSRFLAGTLEVLAASPFRDCKITVLDNCSTDETAAVCAAIQPTFPHMTVIRHRMNIGGNANYLRAVEISCSRYTWIVCDDDTYDFSAADDIIAALKEGTYDLILLRPVCDGGVVKTGTTSASELVGMNFMYYFSLSFFPAVIFRTELFDSDCLMQGYRLIPDSYPQFGFINKSVDQDFSVYIPSPPLVIRNDVNVSTFSPLSWYKAWLTCANTIDNSRVRLETIDQATRLRGFFKSLFFWIALEKKINRKDFFLKVGTIFLLLDPWKKLRFILLTPAVLIPLPFRLLLFARKMVYKFLGVPDEKVPPVEIDQQL